MGRFDVHRHFSNDDGQPPRPDEGGSEMSPGMGEGESDFGEQIGDLGDNVEDKAHELKGKGEQKFDDMTD
jgi:hypothetical protein